MKTCIRFTLAAAACYFAIIQPAFADDMYISDSAKTTAVALGNGVYETVSGPDTNGIAVTRDGILIISPDTEGAVSVTDGSSQRDIRVIPALKLDFESDDAINEYAQFSGSRKQDENGCYLDAGEENALIDISAVNISGGTVRIGFRMYKADAEACDLIKLTGADGTALSQITLSKRSEESMYLSYLDGGAMIRMRNVLINVGEWLDAELSVDFDTKKADLTVDGALLLKDTPVAEAEIGLKNISFGMAIDDVTVSCGKPLDSCGIEIGAEAVSVKPDAVSMINPEISLEPVSYTHLE